jgi:hypothetical protein
MDTKVIKHKIIGQTTKCIVCLKDATCITGHVVKGKYSILAGWCDEHHETILTDFDTREGTRYLMNTLGCFGGWHKMYGFKERENS